MCRAAAPRSTMRSGSASNGCGAWKGGGPWSCSPTVATRTTPGTAPGSVRPFNDVLRLAQEVDVTVFAIGLGANVDRERLEALATTTGGLALFPSDVVALEGEYQRIVENLRRRYVVSYTSTNAKRNGGWRQRHHREPDTAHHRQKPRRILRTRRRAVKLRPLSWATRP